MNIISYISNKTVRYEYIDKQLALKHQIRIIPAKTYYHSTSSTLIQDILKYGLCKHSISKRQIYTGIEDTIYITTYPEKSWADIAVEKYGGKPVYLKIKGYDIIKAGCKAYPDWEVEQPVSPNGTILTNKVTHIVLLNCECVEVSGYKYFTI